MPVKWPSNAKMIGLVESAKPPRDYPAQPLFTPDSTVEEYYEFDVITGNTGILNFRNPEAVAGVQKLMSIKRVRAKLHVMREKKSFSERLVRLASRPGTKMDHERFEARLQRELADLDALFLMTWEKIRWDLLMTGATTVAGEDAASYDFGLVNTVTMGNPWNVPAESHPISDIVAMKKTLKETWGEKATELWLSTQALLYFMTSAEATSTQGLLTDAERTEFARTGTVKRLLDLDIIICDDGYKNAAGTFVPFMSSNGTDINKAMLKSAGPVGVMVDGPAFDPKAPEGHTGRFVKSWEEEDPGARQALETWTGFPGLTQPNKLYIATLW